MNRANEELFATLARVAERQASEFNAQELANTAWALATMNLLYEKQFTTLVKEAKRQMSEFNTQGLANTTWALATVRTLAEKLITALAREAERRASEFNEPRQHGLSTLNYEPAKARWAYQQVGDSISSSIQMAL